ncbi:hypothetical protein L345_08575, partial [Ophiophagus hannah]
MDRRKQGSKKRRKEGSLMDRRKEGRMVPHSTLKDIIKYYESHKIIIFLIKKNPQTPIKRKQ